MIAFTNLWDTATDKGRWSARGATFVAKVKATKLVWFPPDPKDSGTKAAATAKKATKKATKKGTSTAKKTTGKPTKKAASTAKKATSGARS
jgi:hypothetical protein